LKNRHPESRVPFFMGFELYIIKETRPEDERTDFYFQPFSPPTSGTRGRFQRKWAARKRRSITTAVPVSIAAILPAGSHRISQTIAPATHALA